jgi:hypothetical protein
MANRQRNQAKEQHWRRLIAEWRRSQLNIRAFCKQRQLSEPSFHAWRRTLAERDRERTARRPRRASRQQAPTFVPLRVVPEVSDAASGIEVVLTSGHVLRVRSGFDVETLRQLLAVLVEVRSC